jgi:hypothetical protein
MIMSYQSKDYVPEIIANETWKKCFSPTNINKLLDFLIERQFIPSQVSINRALTELKFTRTDGGSAKSDAQAAVNAAQRNLDQVVAEAAAAPLSPNELAEFASLSAVDLQRHYWDNDGFSTFAVRYNKAVREFGYRIPARPTVEEVIDDSKEIKLTAAEYHNTPAKTVCHLQTSPAYKRAVNRLIKAGAIALVLGLLRGGF